MNILFVSAEVYPFAKVGGLADVAGSLPSAIKELGHDIRVILPLYGGIDAKKYGLKDAKNSKITLKPADKEIKISLKEAKLPETDVKVYFIENQEYYGITDKIYPTDREGEFEQERFVLMCYGALEAAKKLNFKPDIIHCNDWHSSNIPVLLKTKYKNDGFFENTSTVLTIHNAAYQGVFDKKILKFAGLDYKNKEIKDILGFEDGINCMKGGIICSDAVNTVSQKYALEMQTKEFGENLEGLFKKYSGKLSGILNGIDYNVWNPQTDKNIASAYSKTDLKGKSICKADLQKECSFEANPDIPVMGIVSRLVVQKGFELLFELEKELKELNIQLVVLGTGDEIYEKTLKNMQKNTENIKVSIGFNSILAEKIYAGCDFFLMPSRFEPCGLGQMIALRYATVPIVRATGGLADTIIDFDEAKDNSNGFVFQKFSSKELLKTVKRAVKVFEDKKEWKRLQLRAMDCDFSWEKSAQKYIELYQKVEKS